MLPTVLVGAWDEEELTDYPVNGYMAMYKVSKNHLLAFLLQK